MFETYRFVTHALTLALVQWASALAVHWQRRAGNNELILSRININCLILWRKKCEVQVSGVIATVPA